MSRKTAREKVFKAIYQYCVTGEDEEFTVQTLLEEAQEANEDITYISSLRQHLHHNLPQLEQKIESLSQGFALSRIYKVDMAILLVAMTEMYFMQDIPISVSINEAVDLAKKYSAEKSSVFINGLLASVAKECAK